MEENFSFLNKVYSNSQLMTTTMESGENIHTVGNSLKAILSPN